MHQLDEIEIEENKEKNVITFFFIIIGIFTEAKN